MPGRLSVIGLGPGCADLLAPMALASLVRAGAVVGYDRYMTLVDPALLHGKTLFSSPMKKEMERTAKAVEFALAGLDTVVVSSGDSGVYGMAGLVLEYLEREGLLDKIELEIVP
ncbi:MAG: SAM-dependent methyltransferase, partial [Desulfomicrobium sp.]|nr:SAM-dependent methyltransferase [Desulfomicrobium sp.]